MWIEIHAMYENAGGISYAAVKCKYIKQREGMKGRCSKAVIDRRFQKKLKLKSDKLKEVYNRKDQRGAENVCDTL